LNAIANASVVVVLIPIRSVNKARKRERGGRREGRKREREIKKIKVFFKKKNTCVWYKITVSMVLSN